ncbi:LOW QUALITY PROTEIN: calcium-dependent protein kinase 26-like [Prosopis cineraria]|uniref:LOW QUALITY PROTEIN: calcium-dependent protein kinase 26-like n=1 Tax=Prosopis cineraria TaxID=364024 RepID=UPI00240FEB0F|nr:LOW QUALITY PROTEIN: calcium-dependent protein kinase 26-like [Prosopis cineraria]
MGNNCVCFGSRTSKDKEVPKDSNSSGCCTLFSNFILCNDRKANENAAPSNNEPNASNTVVDKPPEVVKIAKDEPKSVLDNATKKDQVPDSKKSSEPIRHVEESRVAAPSTTGTTRKAESSGPKKPYNVKRQAAAGLKAESVLQTKTGNLKEFYTLGRKLGNGQFGTTFHCVEKDTGKEYACKSIAKRKLITEEDVEDVRREIRIMHHLAGCPDVISIKGAYEDAVAVHVVMELCAGGELFDRIVQRGHYTERKAAQIARTVVGVIEACHSLGVMHRDLKPENFLFVNEQEDSPLKAIDFGLSAFFKPGDIFNDVVGSPYYVAPEVLKKRYGPEADVWSAGVIIFILLSGVPPFWAETEQEIFKEVLHGELDFKSEPWPSISECAKDLVRKMLNRDPSKRLTAHEVLCHPWIRVDGSAPDKPLDPAVLTRLKQFSAMDKLKKMALRVIAQNLSEEEIAGLKEMFKMIDTDNSGQITFEELKAGLKAFGANIDETEIHNLMQAADVDNSGTIDYAEFIAATLNKNKAQKEDNLVAAFHYFDKDGSGYITQDELQQVCEELGLENDRLEEMMREADQDNDGRIDYDEFVAMMQRGNADMGRKGVRGKNSISIAGREPLSVC